MLFIRTNMASFIRRKKFRELLHTFTRDSRLLLTMSSKKNHAVKIEDMAY